MIALGTDATGLAHLDGEPLVGLQVKDGLRCIRRVVV